MDVLKTIQQIADAQGKTLEAIFDENFEILNEEKFDSHLDKCNVMINICDSEFSPSYVLKGLINICNSEFSPSYVLKELDPINYNESFWNWLSWNGIEFNGEYYAIEDLERWIEQNENSIA